MEPQLLKNSEYKPKIAVIGLGYVGLPLAVKLATNFSVVGFDIDAARIHELQAGYDRTNELNFAENSIDLDLLFSSREEDIASCEFKIVTVPTPIDEANTPNFSPLIAASNTVGNNLNAGDVVVFESTVHPGATEEICVPILEKSSSLKFANSDNNLRSDVFYVGYSPERINPGSGGRKLDEITKVISACCPVAMERIRNVYEKVTNAGVYEAESIKVAEAAKVIENVQRDVNIALVNEFAKIFSILNIDTSEVLRAAGTKWNFLDFRPGLVGGHCIGVDPYYLTQKAISVGYNPQVILSGRRVNDSMGEFVATKLVKAMLAESIEVSKSKVLLMGLTFKENCPDMRNSKSFDIARTLQQYTCTVVGTDPYLSKDDLIREGSSLDALGLTDFVSQPGSHEYEAVILAVAHQEYLDEGLEIIRTYGVENHVIFDVKARLPKSEDCLRL